MVFEKQLAFPDSLNAGGSQRLGWRPAVMTMIFNQGHHVPSSWRISFSSGSICVGTDN